MLQVRVLGNGKLVQVQPEQQQRLHSESPFLLGLRRVALFFVQILVCFAVLVVLHPGELDLAPVDVVPYCLPVPASETGLPHPCPG